MQVQADSHATVSGRNIALWAGVLGSPLVWAVQLQTVYALSPWLCTHGLYVVTHVISLAFLLLSILLGWLSSHEWKSAGAGSPDSRGGSPQDRSRFLGALGVFSCVVFATLIVVQALPAFFFDACWL